jgi:hypothetical protein
MTFATFSSALKNAYDIVLVDAAYADEHKVRDLLEKIMPTSKVQQMEVMKGRVRDDFPTDFDRAMSYIASRIAEIYDDDIAKLNRFGIGKRNRQVYETKSDGPGRGRGRGSGGRFQTGNSRGDRAGRGGRFGARNAGRGGDQGGNTARVNFNGINATDPTRLFNSAKWDQLGNAGHAYVTRERERLNGGGRGANRGGGRGDGRGGRQGGGRIVNKIVVQQDGDASTVTSRGGKSGSGFGIGAHGQGNVAPT